MLAAQRVLILQNETSVISNFSRRLSTPQLKSKEQDFVVKVGTKRPRSDQGDLDELEPENQKKFKSGNPELDKTSLVHDLPKS